MNALVPDMVQEMTAETRAHWTHTVIRLPAG
jgi:hypothetical protein